MTSQTRPLLERRVNEKASVRPLTREQQVLLWQKWIHEGNSRARDRLVRASQRHVMRIAAHYRDYDLPLSRLVCEGNRGVLWALQNYDIERGYRFVTYAAYWIRSRMIQSIIDARAQYRAGPASRSDPSLFRLKREQARMAALIGERNKSSNDVFS